MTFSPTDRSRWMSDLALAGTGLLQARWDSLEPQPEVLLLEGPQTGLTMLRARAGNTGARFNLGEMSLTTCAVTVNNVLGQAWVAGICPDHARLAAIFDSLLQQEDYARDLTRDLLLPLRRDRETQLAARQAESVPTRVDFFTLVRGED